VGRINNGGRQRHILWVGAASLALLAATLWVLPAVAVLQTPDACDPHLKYHCAHVDYDNYGSYVQVYNRWFTGARDGGAQYWRLDVVYDWSAASGSWQVVATHGLSPWYNNVCMGAPYHVYYPGCAYTPGFWESRPNGTIAQPAWVDFKMRYYECTPTCYYWCSQWLGHDLRANTSTPYGAGGPC